MNNPKAAIAILVVTHFVAGLILGWFAEAGQPTIFSALFIGLVFCQTSLLGFWGGLVANRWPLRLLGVAAGTAYLGSMIGLPLGRVRFLDVLIVALSAVAVATVLLVIRLLVGQVQRCGEVYIPTNEMGLQFQIRHLMLLTLVVACILTLGRWLHPYFPGLNEWAELTAFGVCFVAVALASVWAMFGGANVLRRSTVVLLIAASSACIQAYFLLELSLFWFWISMMLSQAAFLLASLGIVRRCGFRLVRRSRLSTPSSH